MQVLVLIIMIVAIAFLAWVIDSAPFISASFKPFIKWILMVIVGALVLLWLLSMVGYGPGIGVIGLS